MYRHPGFDRRQQLATTGTAASVAGYGPSVPNRERLGQTPKQWRSTPCSRHHDRHRPASSPSLPSSPWPRCALVGSPARGTAKTPAAAVSAFTADEAIKQITAADGTLRFDVAENAHPLRLVRRPRAQGRHARPPHRLRLPGLHLPRRHADQRQRRQLADGSPEFPDKVLGQWSCWGWHVGAGRGRRGGAVADDPPRQLRRGRRVRRRWSARATASTTLAVALERAITGGTGAFAGARGVQTRDQPRLQRDRGHELPLRVCRRTGVDSPAEPPGVLIPSDQQTIAPPGRGIVLRPGSLPARGRTNRRTRSARRADAVPRPRPPPPTPRPPLSRCRIGSSAQLRGQHPRLERGPIRGRGLPGEECDWSSDYPIGGGVSRQHPGTASALPSARSRRAKERPTACSPVRNRAIKATGMPARPRSWTQPPRKSRPPRRATPESDESDSSSDHSAGQAAEPPRPTETFAEECRCYGSTRNGDGE